ncbi:MAG: hypothetical protein D6766_06475 [Verrucomicrobia bacterium]|nr:MAG: hypothetical protein D6766_06475 [Verrucomicrobiota bacterium]
MVPKPAAPRRDQAFGVSCSSSPQGAESIHRGRAAGKSKPRPHAASGATTAAAANVGPTRGDRFPPCFAMGTAPALA